MQLEKPDIHPNFQTSMICICDYNSTHILAMYIKKHLCQRSANDPCLLKTNPRQEFLGWEEPPMLHFSTTLHKHTLIRNDIHSLVSVLPLQQNNSTFENLPTLGFKLLLCIISLEKHKNKLHCKVKGRVKLYIDCFLCKTVTRYHFFAIIEQDHRSKGNYGTRAWEWSHLILTRFYS